MAGGDDGLGPPAVVGDGPRTGTDHENRAMVSLEFYRPGKPVPKSAGTRTPHCPTPAPYSLYFSRNRCSTYGGTRLLTSPPCWATSLTRLELRNEYCGLAVMNIVSTPES